MARSELTKTSCARGMTGSVLTDATFTTLSTGSGNGVYFSYLGTDLIVLKNDTGGDATFTFVISTPSSYSTYGITITSPTVVVANGKTTLIRVSDLFKDADGEINIDCDVAGKVLVYNLNN